MATVMTRGFTIIELMLFLGITGAIFAALMIGVNNNITQQHYKESVQNYGALLQNQYSEVANTRMQRDDNLSCGLNVAGRVEVTTTNGSGDLPGGPSRTPACVILGRAVQIERVNGGTLGANDNGSIIHIYPVIGMEPNVEESLSDIETLVSYNPNITDQFNQITTRVEWGSNLKLLGGQSSEVSFLILRSPASGLVRVFASDEPLKSVISEMINPQNAMRVVTNCVDGQRGLLPMQSVKVDASIAGPDGVIITENDSECA